VIHECAVAIGDEAANEVDVLSAPINIPSHAGDDEEAGPPKHVAKDVVNKIRGFGI
jgi:hypothetical protein